MKKFLVVVVLSLLTAACSSGTSRWMEAYGPNFPVPKPGLAALYIVRGDVPQEAPPINITMSGQLVGGVTSLTWMLFDLPPSLYDLRAVGALESNELIITVAPGETRFLLVQPTTPDNAQLLEMSQLEGRRLVRQGQHMQELR
ncbi:MAG TPA: hypothetical protein VI232_03395 [Reyranella sp.]|jgi:hypothetical protein|nr:hypothetical protein [Rhodospirillaceae bacterium]MEA2810652.1 hypothetical protein [Rhodospirillaceae bacterium]MEA2846197.1 hypothetical protein [Rhodospirillaceae bacterium]